MATFSDTNRLSGTTAEFRSIELEEDFRQEVFDADRRRAILVVGFVALLIATLLLDSFANLEQDAFLEALGFQVLLLLFFLVVLGALPRLRSKDSLDRLLLAWSVVIVVATIYMHLAQPVTGQHPLDVLMILIVSAAIPNRFLFQALPGIALALVSLLHIWLNEGTGFRSDVGLWSSFIGATVIGVMLAWQSSITKRRLFRARREVRTLRGIMPICTQCKAIRDESGDWHRMEAYITSHTEAQLSHGMCPTCFAQAMAELEG